MGTPAYPANIAVTVCLCKSVVAFADIILITNPSYHWWFIIYNHILWSCGDIVARYDPKNGNENTNYQYEHHGPQIIRHKCLDQPKPVVGESDHRPTKNTNYSSDLLWQCRTCKPSNVEFLMAGAGLRLPHIVQSITLMWLRLVWVFLTGSGQLLVSVLPGLPALLAVLKPFL